ncbi:neuferricin-like [Tetranychus urticae]|uniref:neuferricin-like n=1 Tax=Tetranychus urticae TaxID=32264 RepID=UPI00077BDCFF|nr:neuferricin-like [Tetranychus urticae]
MKLIIVTIISLLVPFIGISIVYVNPCFKDQSIELIFFVFKTVYHWIQISYSGYKSVEITISSCLNDEEVLLSKEELAQFTGDKDSKIYLAFLGVVYDVSDGSKHYKPGGTYSLVTGKDATRAFVTGQFTEKDLTDDVTDLSIDYFSNIRQWENFYKNGYKKIGHLIGTYYDELGCPTKAVDYVQSMYTKL